MCARQQTKASISACTSGLSLLTVCRTRWSHAPRINSRVSAGRTTHSHKHQGTQTDRQTDKQTETEIVRDRQTVWQRDRHDWSTYVKCHFAVVYVILKYVLSENRCLSSISCDDMVVLTVTGTRKLWSRWPPSCFASYSFVIISLNLTNLTTMFLMMMYDCLFMLIHCFL